MRYIILWCSHFYPLTSGLVSMLTAQILKSIYVYLKDGDINIKKWISSGGMPSSHSAMVMAVTTSVGLKEGWASSIFCVSAVFSIIVLYDASGVRQAVGNQGVLLNQLVDDLLSKRVVESQKIKELLGHTPAEVLIGALLGIGIAFTLFY